MRSQLFLLVFLVFSPVLHASEWSGNSPIEAASALRLHEHRQWLQLLHFREGADSGRSEIISDDFFLARDGLENPEAELRETIRRFGLPFSSRPDEHAICRFPARYLWLARQLGIEASLQACTRFNDWASLNRLESVSLMLISGYFGNPASTFGHVLMKINNGDEINDLSLLDMGVNYGALVPPNEPAPLYVLRGLFGGYQAGFSDRNFYQYDQTYLRTEFRNMWEYELALTPYQRELLVSHVWELAGKKMRYYFLKENCAYRLAQLLELVTQESFVEDVQLWYAPVSVFNRLTELNENAAPGEGYIKSITFVPSAQETLYAKISLLSGPEKALFSGIVSSEKPLSVIDGLSALRASNRATLIDAVLAYYQFLLVGIEGEAESADADLIALQSIKQAVLLERLALPARAEPLVLDVPDRRSPAEGEPPSVVSVGVGTQQASGAYGLLRYAPFHFDSIGNNELNRSSLVILDTTVRAGGSSAPRLDRLDIVRVRKTNRDYFHLPGVSEASWEVAFGYQQERRDCGSCGVLFASGAWGRSYDLAGNAVLSARLGANLQDGEDKVQALFGGALVLGDTPRWSGELDLEYRAGLAGGDGYPKAAIRARYSFSRTTEIRLELGEDRGAYSRIGLAMRW